MNDYKSWMNRTENLIFYTDSVSIGEENDRSWLFYAKFIDGIGLTVYQS